MGKRGESNRVINPIARTDDTPLIVKHQDFLLYFNQLSSKERRKLLHTLKGDHIRCLSEIFSNFLKKRLTVDPNIVRRLLKYKSHIKTIALKKTPLYKKRKILSSARGGGILTVLLPLAASVLGGLL